MYSATTSSSTDLVDGDYEHTNFGGAAYSDSSISYASWAAANGNNTWTFNSTGKAAISLTSVTKMGIREVYYDVGNTAPPISGASSQETSTNFYTRDIGDNAYSPRLVVNYTSSSGGTYPTVIKEEAVYNTLYTNLPGNTSFEWGIEMLTPTSFSNGYLKTGTVTLWFE